MWRSQPCSDLVNMSPTRPRGSPASRTSPSLGSNSAAATPRPGAARAAALAPAGTPLPPAPCTTSATSAPAGPSIWSSPSPAITAPTATSSSPPTSPTWPGPSATTPAASRTWPSGSLPRTVCRTRQRSGTCGATTASSSPGPPSRTGSRRPGKKKIATIQTSYLDEALAAFSGYLAVDELYDGPCCVLSVVDNRRYNRLAFRVLDHKPRHKDVRAFLREFKAELDKRGLVVRGITTDGSSLYPKVLKSLWPDARHQVCHFHVLMDITKSVLRGLAKVRKEMKTQIPKQKRGRPGQADRAQARRIKRLRQRVAELFEHRHLFVKHHLSAVEKKVLKRLTRGRPQLRALRQIMDEVYRLFDRRCRTATALGRLEKLRRRVRGFKGLGRALGKLNSPTVEKALEFLDDKLLGSTSNAVERSNRRYRKAQKTIYGVRTKRHREQRIALDMNREQRASKRARTLKTLHRARSDPDSGHC